MLRPPVAVRGRLRGRVESCCSPWGHSRSVVKPSRLGVAPATPLNLSPGAELCQRSIERPGGFSRVRLEVVSKPGRLRGSTYGSGRAVGRSPGIPPCGTLSGSANPVVTVGNVPAGDRISVCVENSGQRAFRVLGNSGDAHPPSAAYRGEKRIDYDMALVVLRPSDSSLLSLAGDMVRAGRPLSRRVDRRMERVGRRACC